MHSYFEYTHYPYQPVPLVEAADPQRHAITIVGGGPIGLTLALGLARQGVKSVVIEPRDCVSLGSRATCISRRSMEIFAATGCASRILVEGLNWTSGTSYYREKPIYRLQMPMDANQRFYPMVNMQQCMLEQCILDEVLTRSNLIELRWQSKVMSVAHDAEGARLQIESPQGSYAIESDYVVACDGARGVVRQALGLKFAGTQYEGTYIIVDIHLKSEYPTERRAWFDPPSNPGATILMHKQPRDIWRVDYQLRDDEDAAEAVKPEQVLPRVKAHLDWIGETGTWEPVWISSYKANCLTLEKYNHGRVLFAGDAAHLVPIFGVRGLNSGIDDSFNLAWKLAYVVKGIAAPLLLDTYSDERVFAARQNIAAGAKSTEMMAPPSHGFDLMRQAALSLAAEQPMGESSFASLVNPRQTSAITYLESRLNSASSDAIAPRVALGAVLPEYPWKSVDAGGSSGMHLSEQLGKGFTILVFAEAAPDLRNLPAPATVLALGARASVPALYEFFSAEEGVTIVLRPDAHVLAKFAHADLARVCAAIQSALR